jgi:L-rhamnose mutarotase
MIERVGIVFRVKPGKAAEYDRRHATIWPELAQEMVDAGLERYVIYRWGEVLIGHLEVGDYAAFSATMAASEVARRWDLEMDDLIECPNADPLTGWPERMHEVWSQGYD